MDKFGLEGRFHVVKQTPDGKIETLNIPNMVVANGKTTVSSRIVADLVGTAGSSFDFLAIGTGTAEPELTNSGLKTEIMGRIDSEGTSTGSMAQFIGSFGISGTVSVTEYAVFNKSSAGSMLCRATGTALNLSSGDFLTLTYQVITG